QSATTSSYLTFSIRHYRPTPPYGHTRVHPPVVARLPKVNKIIQVFHLVACGFIPGSQHRKGRIIAIMFNYSHTFIVQKLVYRLAQSDFGTMVGPAWCFRLQIKPNSVRSDKGSFRRTPRMKAHMV